MRIQTLALLSILILASSPAHALSEWTVLVYMNGHNNLDKFVDLDLLEMERVGSSEQVQVVAQWAGLSAATTRRLHIQKSTKFDRIVSPVLESLLPVDMGDPKSLYEFVDWGVRNFPAKNYALVLWNHGSGWHSLSGPRLKDISFDDRFQSSIDTPELGLVMDQIQNRLGKKLDLLIADACYMAMAEIASQIKNTTKYMVASQDIEDSEGLPYEKVLAFWSAEKTAEQLAKGITEIYWQHYAKVPSTAKLGQSAIALEKVHQLETALELVIRSLNLTNANREQLPKDLLNNVVGFNNTDYADLESLVSYLRDRKYISAEAAQNALSALHEVVLANPSGGKTKTSGLSIWLPLNSYVFTRYKDNYLGLEFNTRTQWINFLSQILSP